MRWRVLALAAALLACAAQGAWAQSAGYRFVRGERGQAAVPHGRAAGYACGHHHVGDQSLYIEGAAFAERCARELGYQPMTGLKRLSPFDLVGTANLVSLHAEPQDPLDP